MNWAGLVAIMVCAGVISSLTDWFFAGDWIHRRYTYPEIWRQGGEGKAIALTSPLPFVTCGVFAFAAARLGLHSVSGTLKFAVAVWVIGPLPLILTNAAFMKLHHLLLIGLHFARKPRPAPLPLLSRGDQRRGWGRTES